MKVLHIGTECHGGAGLAMYRLHRSLLSCGVDSRILCRERPRSLDGDERLYGYLNDDRVGGKFVHNVFAAVLDKTHLYSTRYYKAAKEVNSLRKYNAMVSSPYSGYRIDQVPMVKEADVVHLHWTANFLDYPSFFSKVKKPIIWTLHDENPAIGYWHYRCDMPLDQPEREVRQDLRIRDVKAKYINLARSLAVVSLSTEYDNWISKDTAFKGRNHAVIPNSIDGRQFRRHGREEIRRLYEIAENEKVLVFVVQGVEQKRKGLSDLFEALSLLQRKDIVLFCVGQGDVPRTDIPNRIIRTGKIEDVDLLSAIFSAGDLFVSPSYSETFGQTVTEALACGVPVVSYPNAGAKDILTEGDGVLCKDFSVELLAAAITEALERKFEPVDLRNRVLSRFAPEKVAQRYIDLYDSILNG